MTVSKTDEAGDAADGRGDKKKVVVELFIDTMTRQHAITSLVACV